MSLAIVQQSQNQQGSAPISRRVQGGNNEATDYTLSLPDEILAVIFDHVFSMNESIRSMVTNNNNLLLTSRRFCNLIISDRVATNRLFAKQLQIAVDFLDFITGFNLQENDGDDDEQHDLFYKQPLTSINNKIKKFIIKEFYPLRRTSIDFIEISKDENLSNLLFGSISNLSCIDKNVLSELREKMKARYSIKHSHPKENHLSSNEEKKHLDISICQLFDKISASLYPQTYAEHQNSSHWRETRASRILFNESNEPVPHADLGPVHLL